MRKAFINLVHDILSRRWRGLGVLALTAAIVLAITKGEHTIIAPFIALIIIIGIIGIVILILGDEAKSMRTSKSNVYSTIIITTIWLIVFAYAVIYTRPMPLSFHVEHDTSGALTAVYWTISPTVLVVCFGVLMLVSAMISYGVSRHRKEIKGIKKEDLFN